MRIKRFTAVQKLFHGLLMISFLVQSLTGMARMYVETSFGRSLGNVFGGYESCLAVHRFTGLFMIALSLCHLMYALYVVRAKNASPEDSLVPGRRDAQDAFRHILWMLGGKEHPSLERWSYWEKFDYWAVFWGMIILGGTGMLLYSPLATSRILEGWTLNVAIWVHRIEALLAMLHVFIIHFATAHLRRSTFPMDTTMFAGDTPWHHLVAERGDWIRRMRVTDQLSLRQTDAATPLARIISHVVGLGAVALGLYLAAGGILNACRINW